MEHQTFADGIGRIAIIDGIVRLDLITHSPTETSEDGKPRPVFSHRVVMGVDQFLRASEKIAETARLIREKNAHQAVAPQPRAAQPAPQAVPRPQAMPAPQAAPQPPRSQPQQVQPQYRRETIHPDRPAPATPQHPFP